MPLICPSCGGYALDNDKRSQVELTCTECGVSTPSNIFPLLVVTGASGSGKSAIVPDLRRLIPECVVFEKDVMWEPGNEVRLHDGLLRMAHSVAQSGRHTVICGTIMPWDMDQAADRGLVGTIQFLDLHCRDDVRADRLWARPAYRKTTAQFVREHIDFAGWFLDNATTAYDPPMPVVDTSDISVEAVAEAVAIWVKGVLQGQTKMRAHVHT